MGNLSPCIYNKTEETVKICLRDTNNSATDQVLVAGETWSKQTEDGWNTIVIIPLNNNQNTFSYTLESKYGVIIERKSEKLILIPCDRSFGCSRNMTFWQHNCGSRYNALLYCWTTGCIVFNESNESIWVCVTDNNQRNTHMLIEHGEYNIVETPKENSIIKKYFCNPESCVPEIVVCVLDVDPKNGGPTDISKAKYSITSCMHGGTGLPFKFLRVIKKDGYFTIEQDTIHCRESDNVWKQSMITSVRGSGERWDPDVPFSYLLSKECRQKVQSMKGSFQIKKISEDKYDVIPVNNDCCIM